MQSINPSKIKDRIKELETVQNADGFWDDPENAKKVSKEISQLQSKIEKFEKMIARIDDALDTIDIVELEGDESEDEKILTTVHDLSEAVESLSLATLLSGKYDSLNAILTLHAGAGGTEAQDWCSMLYRMYTRYCERTGWTCTELDYLAGDEAGIKSVTFRVEGDNAYGYLKAEKGVHRTCSYLAFRRKRKTTYVVCVPRGYARNHRYVRNRNSPRRLEGGHISFLGRRRTTRQQNRVCNPHYAYPDGHNRCVSKRKKPNSKPRSRNANAPFQTHRKARARA